MGSVTVVGGGGGGEGGKEQQVRLSQKQINLHRKRE